MAFLYRLDVCPHNEHVVMALAAVVVSAYIYVTPHWGHREQGTIALSEHGTQKLPGRDQAVEKKERGPIGTKKRVRSFKSSGIFYV